MKNIIINYTRTYSAYLSIFALCTFLVAASPTLAMNNKSEALTPEPVLASDAKLIHSFHKDGQAWKWDKKDQALATFANNGDLLISPGWLDEQGYENPKRLCYGLPHVDPDYPRKKAFTLDNYSDAPQWDNHNDPDATVYKRKQEDYFFDKEIQCRQEARKKGKKYLGDVSVYRYQPITSNGNTKLVPSSKDISPDEYARLNQSRNSKMNTLKFAEENSIVASAHVSLRRKNGVHIPALARKFSVEYPMATFFAPYYGNVPQGELIPASHWEDMRIVHVPHNRIYKTSKSIALKDELTSDGRTANTLLAYYQSSIDNQANPIRRCHIVDLYRGGAHTAIDFNNYRTSIKGLKFSSQNPRHPSTLAILTRVKNYENEVKKYYIHIVDIVRNDKQNTALLSANQRGKILVCKGIDEHVRMEWSLDGKYIVTAKQSRGSNPSSYVIQTYNAETCEFIAACTVETESPCHASESHSSSEAHWGPLSLSPDYSMLIIDGKVYELPKTFAQAHTPAMPNNTQLEAPSASDQRTAKLPKVLPVPHEFAGINMQDLLMHQDEPTPEHADAIMYENTQDMSDKDVDYLSPLAS